MKIQISPFKQKALLANSVSFLESNADHDSLSGAIIGMILTLLVVTGAPAYCYIGSAMIVGIIIAINEGEKDDES